MDTNITIFEQIRPALRKKYGVKYPGPNTDHAAILLLYNKVPDYINHGPIVEYHNSIQTSNHTSILPNTQYSLPSDIVIAALYRDIFFLSKKSFIEVCDLDNGHKAINIVAHTRDIKNDTITHIMELMNIAGYILTYSSCVHNNQYWWQFIPVDKMKLNSTS